MTIINSAGGMDLRGAHFGQGDVHNNWAGHLNTYQVIVNPSSPNGFSYSFPAADDEAATAAFKASMEQLPEATAARLYRMVGDHDRQEVATWPAAS